MNIEQATECPKTTHKVQNVNLGIDWVQHNHEPDVGSEGYVTNKIKEEILEKDPADLFDSVEIKEEWSKTETDDCCREENVDTFLQFSEVYIKSDRSETPQNEEYNNEETTGYSSFVCYNGVTIQIKNKKEKVGDRSRPYNAAERSKRYREKLKQDPDRRTEYLQRIKKKNFKSKKRKLVISGEQPNIKIEVEETPPKLGRRKNLNIPNLYKCNRCDFQTKYKHYIKVHILRHKNPSENEIVRCNHCNYQTIHKTSFRKHILRHKDPQEVEKYQCTQCSYKTSDKAHLRRHALVHINSDEAVVYKCEDCDFQSVHKDSLKKHCLRHKDPSEVSLFKCTDCSFQTPRKESIKMHILRHQNPEDIDMLKCDVCHFQTVHKFSLKSHLLLHKDDKDKKWFKCTECEYQSIYKSSLKKHSVCHKSRDQITMIKCDHCDYKTPDRGHLKRHAILHKDHEEVALKCTLCTFKTLYKATFTKHMARHAKGKK